MTTGIAVAICSYRTSKHLTSAHIAVHFRAVACSGPAARRLVFIAYPFQVHTMCGRVASHLPPDAIRVLFQTAGPARHIGASWNVAPTRDAMVVCRHAKTGEHHLDLLKWGLVPVWTKDLKSARRPINARSETAA